MALFMDVHNIAGGMSAADVAGAHQENLATQGQYGVNYLRYWVDEEAGKIFCLVDPVGDVALLGQQPRLEGSGAAHRHALQQLGTQARQCNRDRPGTASDDLDVDDGVGREHQHDRVTTDRWAVAEPATHLREAPAERADRIVCLVEQQRRELPAAGGPLAQDQVRQYRPALAAAELVRVARKPDLLRRLLWKLAVLTVPNYDSVRLTVPTLSPMTVRHTHEFEHVLPRLVTLAGVSGLFPAVPDLRLASGGEFLL